MATRAKSAEQPPQEGKSRARTVLEALALMAVGAYAWQIGVWTYRGVTERYRFPDLLREPQVLPELGIHQITASSLMRDGQLPGPPGGRARASPPLQPKSPSNAQAPSEVSDRFSMLEID